MAAEHSFNNKDGDVRATAPSMVAAGSLRPSRSKTTARFDRE